MGNATSKEEKEESILRNPQEGKASSFYWACRHGDLDSVKHIFSSSKFNDINCLELNGSTGLHAASYNGHVHVVQFLLQNGIFRHQRNRYGLTAYEEAKNDEIRELFHRPTGSQRFATDTADDTRQLFDTHVEQSTDNNETPEDNWIGGASDETSIGGFQALCHVGKYMVTSSILRPLFMNILRLKDYPDFAYNEKLAVEGMQRLIDNHVTSSHPEYQKACDLLSKYDKSKQVKYLLRLYSLETPFYRHLGIDQQSHCLVTPILFSETFSLKLDAIF
ncbi:unnamed protein product [Rotaria sp. Silwood2]|nr:unnamed protein product [Rotaria sp. Silwood2]